MKTKHTPGPWSADKWAPGYTVSAPNSGYSVAHLAGCNNEEADAVFIAAAPDMLRALQDAYKLLHIARRYFPKSIQNSDKFTLENTMENSVKKAIQKANGEA